MVEGYVGELFNAKRGRWKQKFKNYVSGVFSLVSNETEADPIDIEEGRASHTLGTW